MAKLSNHHELDLDRLLGTAGFECLACKEQFQDALIKVADLKIFEMNITFNYIINVSNTKTAQKPLELLDFWSFQILVKEFVRLGGRNH